MNKNVKRVYMIKYISVSSSHYTNRRKHKGRLVIGNIVGEHNGWVVFDGNFIDSGAQFYSSSIKFFSDEVTKEKYPEHFL